MQNLASESKIIGKTIARVLQTEWEHIEYFSCCSFYIELTDGTLVDLGLDGSPLLICTNDRESLKLHDVEIDTESPAFWSSDDSIAIGSSIEKVLRDDYDNAYLLLSGQYYLTTDSDEHATLLGLLNHKDFVDRARSLEFFDYWTKEPFIVDNMRAIDVIVTSTVDDLDLWQSRELFLTIGRVKDGNVIDRMCIPNSMHGESWTARFVVPEPGTYQVWVQRLNDDFSTDVRIDEQVIAEGQLQIHVV